MAMVPYTRRQTNELARFHRDMDDLIGTFFGGGWPATAEKILWPAIDISEDGDKVVVRAEVPGCKAEDIDISVQGNTMTISGEKKQEKQEQEKGYYYAERSYGSFRRDITLPSGVDPAKVEASCKDGILAITLPKEPKARATKVKVKTQ